MFNSLDQKTTTYVLSGAGVLVTGALLWRYRELLPHVEASWPAIGWGSSKTSKTSE
jgi:hypothetical protein